MTGYRLFRRIVDIDTKLEPILRDSTVERITARLREGIVVGTLAPGQRLREVDIARQLQVSRGPVREAFQRLIQEGLLEAQPARGVCVPLLDSEDIADVYLARRALETAAAHILVETGSPEALRDLRDALTRLREAPASDWVELARCDLRWHGALVRGARSKRLERMFDTLSAETRLCMLALEPFYPDRHQMVVEHGEIVQAIAERDGERAARLLERHMSDSVKRLSSRRAATEG